MSPESSCACDWANRAFHMSAAPESNPINTQVDTAFRDYYRCPEAFAAFTPVGNLSEDCGYFRLGPDVICYGRSSSGFRTERATGELYDVEENVVADGSSLRLPFNPTEIIANVRYERYTSNSNGRENAPTATSVLRKAYYLTRPFLPVSVRKRLQKMHLKGWKNISFPRWPVDASVERTLEKLMTLLLRTHSMNRIPFIWFWPQGYPSCAVMTHDVETLRGRDYCHQLMDLDDAYSVKSSFQVVPERRYSVSETFINSIWNRGFEVNIHDLNHDGHLVSDRRRFRQRAKQINQYGRAYGAAGFRSAALYRNLDWWEDLDFAYDMSVPSVGHLEAQQGGCCTVMPFFVGHILELPVTVVQDYSLFHILNQFSADLWVQQINSISEHHGLLNFIVHPDYVIQREAQDTYILLLAHLARLRDQMRIWIALPQHVNDWWRLRARMRLVYDRAGWTIEGEGRERARIAYASLEGNHLVYSLEPDGQARADTRNTNLTGSPVTLARELP